MNISTDISIWISALLVLAVLSGLYRETVFYKIAEALFIGISSGYFFCLWFFSVIKPAAVDTISGQWHLLIPILAGMMVLVFRESKLAKILALPVSFLAGIFIALNFIIYFRTYIMDMISASVFPLVVYSEGRTIDYGSTLNSLVSFVGTLSVLMFFVARRYPDIKMIKGYGEIGRFYLLVAIGASLSYTLLSRIILFAGRLDFLIYEWLGIGF
jgi:hypothetical protein